ncbi:unnamed protein product [Spirodela intermedia]|uniref:Uncharacterized protein n=1 Tax=Spirodela intermedia TaxID=51605 RepID=A0A7I8I9J8_SPIIN|nr:unnamed protein product [Spirodela intermedia]CAA6654376.1 unnamed protein product [Spirodela intermedia]
MKLSVRAININSCAKKVQVDNRLPLRYYYRTADSLIKQASIYREEKNLIDLYIILLRFSSLMCETIPLHRDYHLLLPKEKLAFKKKLLDVINELEALKPVVQREVDELNKGHMVDLGGKNLYKSTSFADWPSTKQQLSSIPHGEQSVMKTSSQALLKYNNGINQAKSSDQLHVGKQFPKMSFSLPNPKEETLSRHSILGPNGLRGQRGGAITGIRVQYPSNVDIAQAETFSLPQTGDAHASEKDGLRGITPDMDSVLSLFDGGLSLPAPEEDFVQLIKQPSPPPLLARVQELPILHPSKVADPRPGPAQTLQGSSDSNTYQNVHLPVQMMETFLKIAEKNTKRNLETCGVLAGSLRNSKFYVTTLIIPKQESTSDSTHPTQTCFMSSVDLHTHYSYQVMLPEAIAIVMAPTDTSRTHGIFHLSDPGGVSVIRNCQQRGFHPHEEPADGNPSMSTAHMCT